MAIKQITSIPSASPEGKCVAKIREVQGKSLVWNQILRNQDFKSLDGWTSPMCDITKNEDGSVRFTNRTDNNGNFDLRQYATIPAGHKIQILGRFKASSNTVINPNINNNNTKNIQLFAGELTDISLIATASGTSTLQRIFYVPANGDRSASAYIDVYFANFIDLTLMFGPGNEPETVEEFEAMFPENYYEYNSGEIINSDINTIETVGFNQWNEEWEAGTFDSKNGEKLNDQTYAAGKIRNKNYIKVFPNTTYYVVGSGFMYWEYDKTKTYIKQTNNTGLTPNNGLFTTTESTYYINFRVAETVYNHNICINISDPSRNGTYEPYKKSTLPLNISTLTGKLNGEGESVVIFPNGMRSAGSAYDYLIVDEDGYARRAVKVMGRVDLGDCTWDKLANSDSSFRTNSINSTVSVNNAKKNYVCTKYLSIIGNAYSKATDKIICISTYDVYRVIVNDSAYTDAATFKTAMSGVELVYELATPLEYVLDTPILMEYNTDGGTEQIVSSENLLSTPLVADVDYFNTAIKHIQFSDETHCIRDERITGVDYIPTEHSTNVVTSAGVYNAISGFSKTDTKVTQTVTASSNTSFRPLLLGYSYSDATTFAPATVTNTAYATHLAKFAPSTGILSTVGLNKMNTNGTVAEGSDTDVFNTNGTTSTIITSEEIDILPNIPDYSNEALFTEIFAYGVEWDTTVSSPNVTRIGNIALHKQLPIQSAMRGCVVNNKQVVYWLDPSDWSKKLDGTNSVLDGTDGDVMVYVPKFYYRSWTDDTKRKVMISTVKINNTWVESPAMLIDAYHPTLDRTNLILRSIMNTSAQFRGGSNNSAYDTYLSTDIFRTDLGKPATYITRANARIYARNGGKELLNYHQYKAVLYWLFVIEYATFNSQKAVNTVLTSDGYRQGGLGNGMTTWGSNNWNGYNGYGPITPNGYTNSLGNFTGQVAITIPDFTYTSSGNDVNVNSFTCYANRYRGIENPFGDIWTNLEGIIVDANHSDYDLVYTTNNSEFYGESINNGFIISGNSIHSDGYIKQFDLGTTAEIIPYANGASISTYKCDYHYAGNVNSTLRTVFMGGDANIGGRAGLGCFYSSYGVGYSYRGIGFRQVIVL